MAGICLRPYPARRILDSRLSSTSHYLTSLGDCEGDGILRIGCVSTTGRGNSCHIDGRVGLVLTATGTVYQSDWDTSSNHR